MHDFRNWLYKTFRLKHIDCIKEKSITYLQFEKQLTCFTTDKVQFLIDTF